MHTDAENSIVDMATNAPVDQTCPVSDQVIHSPAEEQVDGNSAATSMNAHVSVQEESSALVKVLNTVLASLEALATASEALAKAAMPPAWIVADVSIPFFLTFYTFP